MLLYQILLLNKILYIFFFFSFEIMDLDEINDDTKEKLADNCSEESSNELQEEGILLVLLRVYCNKI